MKDTITYYNELKEIIDAEDLEKLMIYLKPIPKEDFEKVKKIFEYGSAPSLRRYYNESIPTKKLQWKTRGTAIQIAMIDLIFLATEEEKEIMRWGWVNQYFLINEFGKYHPNFDNYFIEILSNRKGKWINKWFTRLRWGGATPYPTLEKLLGLGIIQYDKQTFVNGLVNLVILPMYLEGFPTYEYIRNNKFLLENDLLSIFDFELNFFSRGNNPSINIYWPEIFQKLIDEGMLSKVLILKKCIESSKHNFNKNFLKQYRELFLFLNPTTEEKLTLQHELFELLNQPLSANINFAIDHIKAIVEQKDFDTDAFLLNVESILPRNDTKTGIKNILSIFEKIAKKHKNQSSLICLLVTNCLPNPDSMIQEKAAKIIKTYGDKNDDMLLASLSMYAEQLPKTIIEYLQDFLINENQAINSAENIEYQYIPVTFPQIIQEKPIEYISNWNDLLFQVGKVLKSNNPLDAELLFDGIIRLKSQFPANYKEQLEPFLKQAKNLGWSSNVGILHGMIARFIERWVINFENEINENNYNYFKYYDNFIGLYFFRIRYISNKFRINSSLPLLSTPTHAPFWVSSEVLVSRLLAYEEANESINDLDFLLAITRLVFISDNSIITKAYKLKGLTKNLILYLITDNQEIRIKKSAFLDSTAQTVVRYFFGNETQLTKEEKQTLFWAIAARTKKPDGIFDEFNKTVFKHYPNIVKPYEVNWEIKELEEKQRWNNKVLIENKIILNYYTSYFQNRKLLYSESYYSKKNNHGYMPADTNFIYSFVPNFAEPFFFRMLNVYSIKSDLTSDSQKKAFNESLKTLLIYRPNIDKSANLFLATGFLSNASINRDLSVEIFIQGVTEKRLNVALLGHNIGKLLDGNYAPLQRLSDSLLALKNISALNDAALIIFFENMLIEFTGETPKGFVKLLEFYNELLLNYEKIPSTLLDKNIYKWQENLSLKKQMLKLKGLIK